MNRRPVHDRSSGVAMDELMPPSFPYLIDNVNISERFITINYSDPAQQEGGIMVFTQLVFPVDLIEEEVADLVDLVCVLIDRVQTMRRAPADRIVAPRPIRPGG